MGGRIGGESLNGRSKRASRAAGEPSARIHAIVNTGMATATVPAAHITWQAIEHGCFDGHGQSG